MRGRPVRMVLVHGSHAERIVVLLDDEVVAESTHVSSGDTRSSTTPGITCLC